MPTIFNVNDLATVYKTFYGDPRANVAGAEHAFHAEDLGAPVCIVERPFIGVAGTTTVAVEQKSGKRIVRLRDGMTQEIFILEGLRRVGGEIVADLSDPTDDTHAIVDTRVASRYDVFGYRGPEYAAMLPLYAQRREAKQRALAGGMTESTYNAISADVDADAASRKGVKISQVNAFDTTEDLIARVDAWLADHGKPVAKAARVTTKGAKRTVVIGGARPANMATSTPKASDVAEAEAIAEAL